MYMLAFMKKIVFILFLFLSCLTKSNAEIIKSFLVLGNDRITSETIEIFSKVKIGDNINSEDLNEVIKNIYSSNFFNNVNVKFENNVLQIEVEENYLVQKVNINGVKNKKLKEAILEQIKITEKSSYIENIVEKDLDKISNFLKISGYYFSTVKFNTTLNQNKTIDLNYDIFLGKKALVSKINFTGDKIFKKKTLSQVIITEESKFWKFLTKKKFLNENQINLDKRLLKTFFLNEGYRDVEISGSSASIIDQNNFKLTYNINAGKIYYFNNLDLIIPDDYDLKFFDNIRLILDEMKDKTYSLNKINNLLDELDNIAITKQFEFINASFKEKIVEGNKIDITFRITESQKLYVNRINIYGNDITNEKAIRDMLVVDEGDPLNEILNNKSLDNIRSSGLFSDVKMNIIDIEDDFKKNINFTIEEQPTGEISAGAGYGTSGQTISFGIRENNFSGNATKLDTSLSISDSSIIGGFDVTIPNYNYTDKSLKVKISRSDNDFFDTAGYKNTKSNFTFGTGFEFKQDLFFNPLLIFELEDLETDSTASSSLKKQDGSYRNIEFDYNLFYDKRNRSFRTTDGFYSSFSQTLPFVSNNYSLYNSYDLKFYKKISDKMIGSMSYHMSAINSLEGNDVRVSERLRLSSKKLRGFKKGKVGPKDNQDFIGGNYASAFTLSTTLPNFLPDLDTVDFNLFFDAANLWGVDYNDDLDSNKIRSSTGLSIGWLTPVGPLNFVIAQPITKSSTDIEESFRFDIGTTF